MQIKRMEKATAIELITDWHSLGAKLGIKAGLLSYVLKERNAMQTKIRLGERTVYKSATYLRHIQNRIMALLDEVYGTMPDTEVSLAYRKNLSAVEEIAKTRHATILVTFDIKKYYDHVTLKHIEDSLTNCGFDRLGARLIGRYCVVHRRGAQTLQQGSPASPVLSNIVGHFVFDQPIRQWLGKEYPELDCTYVRYCDNIALFVHTEPPQGFTDAFKAAVKTMLAANGFRTHKWNCISDRNPVKHQKFLGIVLNSQARAKLEIVDRLRAILFNWCCEGTRVTARRFANENGITPTIEAIGLIATRLKQHLSGHINYIARINKKQGEMLKKLYEAAVLLDNRDAHVRGNDELFSAIKMYRKHDEDRTVYIGRLESVLNG